MTRRLCVYYIKPRPKKRWFPGDQWIRRFIKKILGKKERISSLELVYIHLCRAFDRLGVDYVKNPPFKRLQENDIVIMLGHGKACLRHYKNPNPIIAGISLMSHPAEWPDLFEKYPVKVYLQHSDWTLNIYRKHYGERCDIWPVGIDTDRWKPDNTPRDIDVLIYNKILIDREKIETLLAPICDFLRERSLKTATICYGAYTPEEFRNLLRRSKCMIYFCEHESQGIAYQETLSMGVPIFAWDQGKWLDPDRFAWGEADTEATSVPYFDERCGATFRHLGAFYDGFPVFWSKASTNSYHPREYILENLTLEKSGRRMLDIVNKWIK
jgi:hypothetical protein